MASPLAASFLDRRGENAGQLGAALNDAIWGLPPGTVSDGSRLLLQHYNALSDDIDHNKLPFATHNDVVDLINIVKRERKSSFRDLRTALCPPGQKPRWLATGSEAETRAAVEFAVALWLMIQTRLWTDDNHSLCDFVQRVFPSTNAPPIPIDAELSFNGRSLWAIGGITLVWTSRLSEHLRLNKRTSELYVFRYASLLGRRKDTGQDEVYPTGLLRETAETVALLFPLAETSNKNWHRRIRKRADVDVEAGVAAYTPRNLDHYNYWRERLDAIQTHYDQTAPKKLRQWVHDRRDSNRFYTFWLAVTAIVLTLLFGLIQSVTGIIGVVME